MLDSRFGLAIGATTAHEWPGLKTVYWDKTLGDNQREVLLDLIIYRRSGEQVGRESVALDGPRTYEPCCPAKDWVRIPRPTFPLEIKWITDPANPGVKTAGYWFGHPLPPAKWTKPPRRPKARIERKYPDVPSFSHEQLNHLVEMFESANDPMSVSIAKTADALRRFIWASQYRS